MNFNIAQFAPFLVVLFIFYFLIIRPQQQKAAQIQKMLAGLKKGDVVTTTSGIIGKVQKVSDKNEVILEIADNVDVKFAKDAIVDVVK